MSSLFRQTFPISIINKKNGSTFKVALDFEETLKRGYWCKKQILILFFLFFCLKKKAFCDFAMDVKECKNLLLMPNKDIRYKAMYVGIKARINVLQQNLNGLQLSVV